MNKLKSYFKASSEEEAKRFLEEERALVFVKRAYIDSMRKYTGNLVMLGKRYDNYFWKLIFRCLKINVQPDVFIEVQIRELVDLAGKKAQIYVSALTSQNAIDRFSACATKAEKDQRIFPVPFNDESKIDLHRVIVTGMQLVELWLDRIHKKLGHIDLYIVSQELKILARCGTVPLIYWFCSPVIRESENEELSDLFFQAMDCLETGQQLRAMKIHDDYQKDIKEGVREFV